MKKKTVRKRKGFPGVFYGITSRVAIAVLALLLLLSYASIVVNPARIWMISLAGLFFIPLATANAFVMLWALKRRSKAFLMPLVALLPCLFFAGRYFQAGSAEETGVPSDPVLKMVTYNVGRFHLSSREGLSREECIDSIFDFISREDADIICLQEFHIGADEQASVKSYISRRMKGYSCEYYMFTDKTGLFGNVTLSRFPITDKGVIKFDRSSNLAIYTDHNVGNRRFRVYNCHFESYNISFTGMVRAIFRSGADVFSETGTKMKRSILRRPRQVDKVLSDIESCPVESFVCGDFNDNPMSYTYYRMRKGRKDSFVEAGHGFGATFSRLWPMLRIDYILLPERFGTLSCRIPRIGFSDHYPVVSEVEI